MQPADFQMPPPRKKQCRDRGLPAAADAGPCTDASDEDVKAEALRFLGSKKSKMSQDGNPAVFSKQNMQNEMEADTKSPYEGKKGSAGLAATYPGTADTLLRCRTITVAYGSMRFPSDFKLMIIDIQPYFHPVASGKFVYLQSISREPAVVTWFWRRVMGGVKKLASTGNVPVLYVVEQVML